MTWPLRTTATLLNTQARQRRTSVYRLDLLWGRNEIEIAFPCRAKVEVLIVHLHDVEGEGDVLYARGADRARLTPEQPFMMQAGIDAQLPARHDVLVHPVRAQVTLHMEYMAEVGPNGPADPRVIVTERMPTE